MVKTKSIWTGACNASKVQKPNTYQVSYMLLIFNTNTILYLCLKTVFSKNPLFHYLFLIITYCSCRVNVIKLFNQLIRFSALNYYHNVITFCVHYVFIFMYIQSVFATYAQVIIFPSKSITAYSWLLVFYPLVFCFIFNQLFTMYWTVISDLHFFLFKNMYQ